MIDLVTERINNAAHDLEFEMLPAILRIKKVKSILEICGRENVLINKSLIEIAKNMIDKSLEDIEKLKN